MKNLHKAVRAATVAAALFAGMLMVAIAPVLGDAGTGILYGTDPANGLTIIINPLTGASVPLGPTGVGAPPSLAVDPTTGVIYGGHGQGNPNLYTVSPVTGTWTLVAPPIPGCGNTNLGFSAIGGMDFRSDGTLFAAVNIAGDGGTGSDHLAILDKTTGLATLLGPFGACAGVTFPCGFGGGSCSIEGIESLAFDTAGNLWGAKTTRGRGGAPGLYRINPATGAATFHAPILDAAGNPPSGGLSSLQFACDGTLFGGTARGFGVPDSGHLVTVNPATGQFSFVGPVAAAGNSLAALAFELPCEECDPDPRTQGYWHRQCLGVPAADGGIDPGRNGRGPQGSPEPDFDKLMDDVSPVLFDRLFLDQACADGMDADPPSDPCQRAVKQYTALLFNLTSDRLQNSCEVDLSAEGCSSTTIGDLADELAALIIAGDCHLAAECAEAVNEGTALERVSVAGTTDPSTAPQTTTLSGSTLGGAAVPEALEIAEPMAERVSIPAASIPMVLSGGSDVVEYPSSHQEAAEEVEEDPLQAIERHLMILTDGSSLLEDLEASTDALLTALSGGYELETRLAVAKALLGSIDVSLHSLLAAHLEDIRSEAEAFDKLDLAQEAAQLLKGLEHGE